MLLIYCQNNVRRITEQNCNDFNVFFLLFHFCGPKSSSDQIISIPSINFCKLFEPKITDQQFFYSISLENFITLPLKLVIFDDVISFIIRSGGVWCIIYLKHQC